MVIIKSLFNNKDQSQNNKKKLQSWFHCPQISSLIENASVIPLIVLFIIFLVLFLYYLRKKMFSLKKSKYIQHTITLLNE